MNEQYIAALVLTDEGAGFLHSKIAKSIKCNEPIDIQVLKEALAVESRSIGSRSDVRNILAREIERQESLMKVAA